MYPLVRRALGAACAVTVTLGLTAGLAPSAYAEKLVREDARRDVIRFGISSGDESSIQRAPRAADPDIVRVTIDHRERFLLIRTRYAGLERRLGRLDLAVIRTSAGKRFEAGSWVNKRGKWQGETGLGTGPAGKDVACAGLRHHFDYAANVATWSIPRSCLGRPRWVRVGVGGSRGSFASVTFIDEAFRNGADLEATDLALSRRIWRG